MEQIRLATFAGPGIKRRKHDADASPDAGHDQATPGLFPGLCVGLSGISPSFERFLFAPCPRAAAKKAYICWEFSGRSGRI